MRADRVLDQLVQAPVEIALAVFEPVGEAAERVGHGGVEHDVRAGDRIARADHAELELVAGEGEGRGAVAVGGVAVEARQHIRAEAQALFLFPVSISRITAESSSPRKIEMTAGGASFAPRRWSLPAVATLARSRP